jgi:hypothetical protein
MDTSTKVLDAELEALSRWYATPVDHCAIALDATEDRPLSIGVHTQ